MACCCAWAAGCLQRTHNSPSPGPYAWVRNPLYIGTLLVAAGLVEASRSIGLGILFAAVFGLIYLPVIQLEEQHLRSLFPEYAEYARRVPALLPRPRPTVSGPAFRPQLYLKNREYEALLPVFWRVLRCSSGRPGNFESHQLPQYIYRRMNSLAEPVERFRHSICYNQISGRSL